MQETMFSEYDSCSHFRRERYTVNHMATQSGGTKESPGLGASARSSHNQICVFACLSLKYIHSTISTPDFKTYVFTSYNFDHNVEEKSCFHLQLSSLSHRSSFSRIEFCFFF